MTAQQLTYGVAVDTAEHLAALPPLPASLSLLKIPSILLDCPDSVRRLGEFANTRLLCGDLLDRGLCSLTPGENLRLRLEFLKQLKQRAVEAKNAGIPAVSASFDITSAENDPGYRENLLAMLRSFCGALDGIKVDFELPLRLPDPSLSAGKLAAFLQELPGKHLGVLAELHPHEAAFAALGENVLRPVAFSVRTMEFYYDAASGNHLTPKLLAKTIRPLAFTLRPLKVIFHPVGLEPDGWEVELFQLNKLISESGGESC